MAGVAANKAAKPAHHHPSLDFPWCVTPKWIGAEGYRACQQCELCLDAKARSIASRVVLEMTGSKLPGVFVTLTLAPDPDDPDAVTVVNREDFTKFVKRLRYFLGKGRKIRYLGVGDYGSRGTLRAHYHLAIIGMSWAEAHLIEKAWPKGHANVRELTVGRAKYVATYVVRKPKGPRADGRPQEFVSQSGGLGRSFVEPMAKLCESRGVRTSVKQVGDIPTSWRQHGVERQLPKYVKDKVRERVGVPTTVFEREGRSVLLRAPGVKELTGLRVRARQLRGGRRPLVLRRRLARRWQNRL